MSEHMYYDEDNNILEVWCTECNGHFEIPCTPEQYARLDDRTEVINKIFPDLPVGLRELFVSGMCGICFDGSTGFFRNSTSEMDKRAHDLHKRLFPDVPEKVVCRTVQDLYQLYKEIQDYVTDYEDCDGFDPKAYNDLEEITKALEGFTKEIEEYL